MSEYLKDWRRSRCDPVWNKRSEKTVLSVVVCRSHDHGKGDLVFHRGINTEVCLPCGSLCAERAAIARAAAEGHAVAEILAVAALDPDDKLNPLWPCEVCQSWLAKLRKEADISVLAFTSTACDAFHVCKEWVPKLIENPALQARDGSFRTHSKIVASNPRPKKSWGRRFHGCGGSQPRQSARASWDKGRSSEHLEVLSRCLATLLRHKGSEFGLQFQEDGFVRVSDLMRVGMQDVQMGRFEDIEAVVRTSYSKDGPRFELMEGQPDVWFIRAKSKPTLAATVALLETTCGESAKSAAVNSVLAEECWRVYQFGTPPRTWLWHPELVGEEWFFEDEAANHGWQKFRSDKSGHDHWWWHQQSNRWFQDPRNSHGP